MDMGGLGNTHLFLKPGAQAAEKGPASKGNTPPEARKKGEARKKNSG